MLYMPAQMISGVEVRLPVLATDLVNLCSLFPEHVDFEVTLQRLFRSSPGLLLYAANHCRQGTGRPVASFKSLAQWVKHSMFDTAIESDAFEFADMRSGHLKRLFAWQDRPTRKQLALYLDFAGGIGKKESKSHVRNCFVEGFCFSSFCESLISEGVVFGKSVAEKIPIRSMWLLCAKQQQLQLEFDENLCAQKMAAMKQLAYGASHEINNPLANIATRAQSLLTDEPLQSKRYKLALIYAQAMRAHEMISDMMLFANPPESNFESVDLVELVESLGREMRATFKASQIKFSLRKYPGSMRAEVDSTQLLVALKAIIENSIQAIGSSGEIRVQLWLAQENEMAVAVIDNGPGIDPAIEERLFDPFYSGREAGRGLGFGLSKAWRIVELHSGNLKIDRGCQSGARVVMRLPVRQQNRQKKQCRIDNMRAA